MLSILSFKPDRPLSAKLLERGKGVMPGGVPMTWMTNLLGVPPPFIERGEGCYFWDVDGHRLAD